MIKQTLPKLTEKLEEKFKELSQNREHGRKYLENDKENKLDASTLWIYLSGKRIRKFKNSTKGFKCILSSAQCKSRDKQVVLNVC